MPIIIDTGALLRPLFSADQFAATRWETAQGKADFGNKLCKFIAADFKQSLFTKTLYGRLSNCFGHIAHYNIHGFFETFFQTSRARSSSWSLAFNGPVTATPPSRSAIWSGQSSPGFANPACSNRIARCAPQKSRKPSA